MRADADRRLDFRVEGMTCGSCAARVQGALENVDGVTAAEVNLATNRARVRLVSGATDITTLKHAVERSGYKLIPDGEPIPAEARGADEPDEGLDAEDVAERAWLRRAVAALPAAAFMVVTMLMGRDAMMNDTLRWVMFGVATPVQFWVGRPFLHEAAKRAPYLTANMDTLISIGTLYVVLLLTLRHVGVPNEAVSWEEALASFAFIRLLSALPITPGGLGVVELGMTATLVAAGGDEALVVAAVLVYRLLTFVLPIPVGAVSYFFWRHEVARRKPAGRT